MEDQLKIYLKNSLLPDPFPVQKPGDRSPFNLDEQQVASVESCWKRLPQVGFDLRMVDRAEGEW